jgi:hypothetical protein
MLDPSLFNVDTSHDEEIARKLFSDLNSDILEPPIDGKIIILDDSDDDDEAQEEKTTDIESTTAPASVDDVMIRGPTRRLMAATTADVAPAILRLLR